MSEDVARLGAIYDGTLRHRRMGPKKHHFDHRLFMLWLDLDRLEQLFSSLRLASTRRWAPIRYRRDDYFGDPNRPLAESVRDLVEQRTGRRPLGPVCFLTHLRTWGFAFNPVSFYYCYSAADSKGEGERRLETIVAEVHNTPWDERYCYVLDQADDVRRGVHRYDLQKDFHVSPFMPMDIDYRWHFSHPLSAADDGGRFDDGRRLFVHMENFRHEQKVFDATLKLERRAALSDRALLGALARHPLMTMRVVAWIYGHAAVLWLKKTPFYGHPDDGEHPTKPAAAKALPE